MIEKMIREARSQRASDIHISEGQAVYLRIDGKLIKSDLELSDEMTRKLILSLLTKERQESIWRGDAHIFRFTMKTISYHNYRIVVRSPIQPPTVKGLPFSKSGCMKISSVEGR